MRMFGKKTEKIALASGVPFPNPCWLPAAGSDPQVVTLAYYHNQGRS